MQAVDALEDRPAARVKQSLVQRIPEDLAADDSQSMARGHDDIAQLWRAGLHLESVREQLAALGGGLQHWVVKLGHVALLEGVLSRGFAPFDLKRLPWGMAMWWVLGASAVIVVPEPQGLQLQVALREGAGLVKRHGIQAACHDYPLWLDNKDPATLQPPHGNSQGHLHGGGQRGRDSNGDHVKEAEQDLAPGLVVANKGHHRDEVHGERHGAHEGDEHQRVTLKGALGPVKLQHALHQGPLGGAEPCAGHHPQHRLAC
mmetsp:Transcript_26307/g.73838  ORF Transcript_26307/g.73838 Transcript_26307/m.73838 type:complete len:259 (+) Transcript_26307:2251-3027(+)